MWISDHLLIWKIEKICSRSIWKKTLICFLASTPTKDAVAPVSRLRHWMAELGDDGVSRIANSILSALGTKKRFARTCISRDKGEQLSEIARIWRRNFQSSGRPARKAELRTFLSAWIRRRIWASPSNLATTTARTRISRRISISNWSAESLTAIAFYRTEGRWQNWSISYPLCGSTWVRESESRSRNYANFWGRK